MKELVVKQQKLSTGFGKPKVVETVAVEFPNGKVAHLDEEDNLYVYDKRSELEKALVKQGKTEIVEKAEK